MRLFGLFLATLLFYYQANACLDTKCDERAKACFSQEEAECQAVPDSHESDSNHCVGHCAHINFIEVQAPKLEVNLNNSEVQFSYFFAYESRNLESLFQPPKS